MKRLLFISLGLALTAAGCGTSANSLCNTICDCTGCSDDELNDCVDNIEDAEKEADDAGCSDQVSEYESCYSNEFECRDSRDITDGCASEAKSLGNCIN